MNNLVMWLFGATLHMLYVYNYVNSVMVDYPREYGHPCTPDCDSDIYCKGNLLHTVQMARIYNDSKSFVDLALRFSEGEILENFDAFMTQNNNAPTANQLRQFIDRNFRPEGSTQWTPPDFRTNPSIVNAIRDPRFKLWALNLNALWREFGLKVEDAVRDNPDSYSKLFIPNGFVKAGGRFNEMYYWDTYWIIRGLCQCDMHETARGIIENMVYMVQKHGHMPNGIRKYYLRRSQPPLLVQMAKAYYSFTKNDTFLKANLPFFEQEFQWWLVNRTVTVNKNGKSYRMARYGAPSCTPRPESYYDDYTEAAKLNTDLEKASFYTNMKSGAESGWDFSSRHMVTANGNNQGDLLSVRTSDLIYVDLNSILEENASVLAKWYKKYGNHEKSKYYDNVSNEMRNAIKEVLWDEKQGIWLDYNFVRGESRNYFYPSNLTPLWTGTHAGSQSYVTSALAYLRRNNVITVDGLPVYYGVPTSTLNSSQQWDFPNCWAPLQSIVIEGLYKSENPTAQKVAFGLAKNWIKTNYAGFIQDGVMYEKYSALELGTTGSGGEYVPQTGFGWTNGFVLDILRTWGDKLDSEELLPSNLLPPMEQVNAALDQAVTSRIRLNTQSSRMKNKFDLSKFNLSPKSNIIQQNTTNKIKGNKILVRKVSRVTKIRV